MIAPLPASQFAFIYTTNFFIPWGISKLIRIEWDNSAIAFQSVCIEFLRESENAWVSDWNLQIDPPTVVLLWMALCDQERFNADKLCYTGQLQ